MKSHVGYVPRLRYGPPDATAAWWDAYRNEDVNITCIPAPDGDCVQPPGGGDDGDDGDGDDGDDGDGGGSSDPPKQLGSAELERSVSIPADAVQVDVTALVSAFAEESNASVEVAVSVGGDTRTVIDLDGESGTRVFDSEYVEETFETPTGEQVTFWVQTQNLSGASVDYVDIALKRDSDGDGLTNRLEKHGGHRPDAPRLSGPGDRRVPGEFLDDGRFGGDPLSRRVQCQRPKRCRRRPVRQRRRREETVRVRWVDWGRRTPRVHDRANRIHRQRTRWNHGRRAGDRPPR